MVFIFPYFQYSGKSKKVDRCGIERRNKGGWGGRGGGRRIRKPEWIKELPPICGFLPSENCWGEKSQGIVTDVQRGEPEERGGQGLRGKEGRRGERGDQVGRRRRLGYEL